MSVLDGGRSLEVGAGGGLYENTDGRTMDGGASQRSPSVLRQSIHVPFLLRSASVHLRSLTALQSLPPFCQPKRSSTDRVHILYSPVRGYKKEIPLNYSSLAHMSSNDMEQTEALYKRTPVGCSAE